jgi:uncharacterized protein YqeY
MIKIDELIGKALKEKDEVRLSVLRSIKAEFLKYKTAKNAKPLDDTAEIQILKKMVSQREESISMFESGGRKDLVEKETNELNILKEFLPAEVTQAEIEEVIEKWMKENNIENKIPKKSMGIVIKYVKSSLPMADGKLTSEIVKGKLED